MEKQRKWIDEVSLVISFEFGIMSTHILIFAYTVGKDVVCTVSVHRSEEYDKLHTT